MRSIIFETLESRTMFSTSAAIGFQFTESSAITQAVHASVTVAGPPTAKVIARTIQSGLTSYTFKVNYKSRVGINASSIATGNLTVSGPNGYTSTPALVSTSSTKDTRAIVAVYSVAPPSGVRFTGADNGVYAITLVPGSVTDINNLSLGAPMQIGTFRTAIKVVTLTAKLKARTITSTVPSYTFSVAYHSSVPLDITTIATGNITVVGPNGYRSAATLVSTTPTHNAKSINAVYSIVTPSAATFGPGDDGRYTVSLAGGSVMNTSGTSAAAATLGTFNVNIASSSTGSLPNMVGNYTGTNIVPSAGSYHYVQLTVSNEDSSGHISGSWVTDVGVVVDFTGTVAADGTFSYTFQSGPNTVHATGPVSGSGTGTGAGTTSLSFSFTATSAGFTAPGSMNVTKA